MAGSLKIRVNLGTSCDPNLPTSEMVLSSTAEPDGGDHIATINWGYSPYAEQLNIQLRVSESPETWIPAPSAFFFTSAGETYTLRTSTGITADRAAQLQFPYMVQALYAPDWAAVYDTLQPSLDIVPDDYCCDLPDVPVASLRTLPINGAYVPGAPGIISGSGTIDGVGAKGLTMYAGYYLGHPEATCWPDIVNDDGTGGTKTYVFNMDPGSYNWYEEAFNQTATYTTSNNGSASVTVTLTKPANSLECTVVMTCGTVAAASLGGTPSLSEVCATVLPDCTYPDINNAENVKFASFKLNCTTRKLAFYGSSLGVGGEFLRPANPIYCCICENVDNDRVAGWSSSLSMTQLEIKVE